VVSSLVHDLLAPTGEFEFGEPRVVELKGISGEHQVFPLAPAVADPRERVAGRTQPE
jgi:hypothetical protein